MGKVFLYTELQASVPFDEVGWRELNPRMKDFPGLQTKTWLSGLNTKTIGGFYEFDTVENARAFAYEFFAEEARGLGVSYQTKLFNGEDTEEASRDMASPYWEEHALVKAAA